MVTDGNTVTADARVAVSGAVVLDADAVRARASGDEYELEDERDEPCEDELEDREEAREDADGYGDGDGDAGRDGDDDGCSPARKHAAGQRRSLKLDGAKPPRSGSSAGARGRHGSSGQDAAAVAAENTRLFALYRDTQSVKVRNDIVGRHMYLIDIITRKFVNRGVEYEDLYQIASIALIKAVERFDLSKGVKFVSFATPTVVGEIKRYFRDKGSTIRIPRRIYEIYQKVNQAKEYLSQSLCRTPLVADIASYLKISEENVLEIIESWNVYNIQSFEQSVYSEDNLELHETIGEDDFEFEKIENRDFIQKSMEKFNESEREFINLRYMNDMTQKEIAAVMSVSQMYISRLEKKIIKKFRIILEK